MVNTNVCHAEVFAHQVIGHTNTGPAFPKPFSAAPPAVSTTTVLTIVNDYLKGNIVTPKKFSLFFSTVTQLKAVPGFQQLHAPHVGHHCTRTWKHSDSVLFRSNSTIAIKLKNHQEDGFSAAPAIRETNKPKSRVVFCFVFYSKIIESRKNKLDLGLDAGGKQNPHKLLPQVCCEHVTTDIQQQDRHKKNVFVQRVESRKQLKNPFTVTPTLLTRKNPEDESDNNNNNNNYNGYNHDYNDCYRCY